MKNKKFIEVDDSNLIEKMRAFGFKEIGIGIFVNDEEKIKKIKMEEYDLSQIRYTDILLF